MYKASPKFVKHSEEIPLKINKKHLIKIFRFKIKTKINIYLISSRLTAAAFTCLFNSGTERSKQSPKFVRQSKPISVCTLVCSGK